MPAQILLRREQISDFLFPAPLPFRSDPRIDAWRVPGTDPVSQTYFTMIGRKQGDAIVQEETGRAAT